MAFTTCRRLRHVMAVRCEGTMSLGRRHSLTYEEIRKMFVPYRIGRASSYLSGQHQSINDLVTINHQAQLTPSDMFVANLLPSAYTSATRVAPLASSRPDRLFDTCLPVWCPPRHIRDATTAIDQEASSRVLDSPVHTRNRTRDARHADQTALRKSAVESPPVAG